MRAQRIHPASECAHGGRARDRGFTLTEILVVIIIIVLMLAMAMPVFRYISGSRSQAGAVNQIAAFLGRCRNDAIGLQQVMGAAFYVDSTTGRTAMVEVEPVSPNVVPYAADPNNPTYYPAYPLGTYVSTATTNNGVTIYSYFVATTAVPATSYQSTSTPVPPSDWMPVQPYDGSVASRGATDNTSTTAGLGVPSGNKTEILPILFDRVPGTDHELLPSGIGVQLLIDDVRKTGSKTPASDRYLHLGTLLFDASGRLTYQPFVIYRGGPIGTAAGFGTSTFNIAQNQTSSYTPGSDGVTSAAPDDPLYSSFGVVVYDRDAWLSQNFPSDWIIEGPGSQSTYGTGGNSPPSEYDEEAWLDNNATPLLIDRYTGTLLRNE